MPNAIADDNDDDSRRPAIGYAEVVSLIVQPRAASVHLNLLFFAFRRCTLIARVFVYVYAPGRIQLLLFIILTQQQWRATVNESEMISSMMGGLMSLTVTSMQKII
jgi:hypothetical protein